MKDNEILLIRSKLARIRGVLEHYNENPMDKRPDLEGNFEKELDDLEKVIEQLGEEVKSDE